MANILLLATAWGPKHGGINAFNMDFAQGLVTYLHGTGRVFCAVLNASHADLAEAEARGVTLLPIGRSPESASYDKSWAYDVSKRLQSQYPDQTIDWWVGHDVVSSAAAVEGPSVAGYGHTAVIMHMSYIDYAGYKHSSGVNAFEKEGQQRQIFTQAHKHFAVGPLLRDAMHDIVDGEVTMLVPGFATISSKPSTARLTLITFGRMDRESDRVKQGSLAIAGFASACRQAHTIPGLPPQLCDNPQMRVIGIAESGGEEERQLRQLAQEKAGRALNILAQPFTPQREPLFDQLGRANLALMLSWHEGFGLTGWEAIAAQVPLIVSRQSGLYRLVDECIGDYGTACLKVLDVQGQEGDDDSANFTAEDEAHVRDAILEMVRDMGRWQQNAASLKGFLADKLVCTWEHTARQFCEALGIETYTPPAARAEGLSEPAPASAHPREIISVKTETTVPDRSASTLIQIPHLEWPDVLKEDVPDRFLLLPASGVVPFHRHRDGLLQRHLDWVLAEDQPIKLWLLAGPGGTGKTRLLIEVCRQLHTEHGWQAGFLQTVDNPAQELQALLRTAHGCLIVIDYAETRAQEVVDLVRTARSAGKHGPLRLVLLARGGGDWWKHLSDKAKSDPEVAIILHSPRTQMGPYYMSEVDIDPDERPAIFREALAAFAAKTGREVPPISTPDLSAAFFQHILFIHLAALAAVRGRAITDHKELLLDTLHHEREYWRRAFVEAAIDAQYLDGFEQLLAILTLIGGTRSAAETRQVIKLTPRLRGTAPPLQDRLFDVLRPFYGRDGGVMGVEPDLLGERLVADALDRDDELLDVVFTPANNTSERRRYAYTVLTRLARQDQHEQRWLRKALERHLQHTGDDAIAVAMETGSPMPEIIAEVLQNPRMPARQKIINTLRVQVPKETINLLELAVTIAQQHVALLVEKGPRKNFNARINAHDAYALLASRYEATGRFTEALDARQKALEFAQALVKSNPGASNRHVLAQAAMSLAEIYSKTCHFREALESARDAESILHILMQEQPKVYRPDWARSLNSLGNRLSELGHYAEALECAQQAEIIDRELAQAQPEVYRPDWARSLHNLGNRLSELGHYAEALECAQQAETIFRELAQAQPEVYRPDWAKSLSNLGIHLSALGHYAEALECAQQAEIIDRELAQAQPEVYRPGWATSLHSLGVRLSELGRYAEALEYAQQAETIFRELAQAQPEVYRPGWATSLNNLGFFLNELERYTEALEYAQQAETIDRELAQAQPEVYRPGWATSLGNVAEALLLAGEALRALPSAEQASELYTALVARYPKTYQEHHGWCYRILAEILLESGSLERALDKAHAAVALLGEMFSERPGHTPAQYGKALALLARCQRAREDLTGSLHTLQRAIRELGPHYERHPAALQTVMSKIVASLRSLAPASVVEEVSPNILDLLERYPASFVPPLVDQ